MSEFEDEPKDNLGSLSQHARTKSLKSAQSILIIIGLLVAAVHAFLSTTVKDQIDKEIIKGNPGVTVQMIESNQEVKAERDAAVKTVTILYYGFVAAGIGMVICGLLIYKAPVICTVTGLVIYIAGWLIPIVLNILGGDGKDIAQAIMAGIIIKILVIVGLCKAVQAAIAYQAETAELK